jgi:hypothetical protein
MFYIDGNYEKKQYMRRH